MRRQAGLRSSFTRVAGIAVVGFSSFAVGAAAEVVDIACSFCSYDEVKHLWRIPGHTVFSAPVELQRRCAYIEMPRTEYYVAADGTQSSVFEVRKILKDTCQSALELPLPVILDPSWQPVASPDPGVYGSFEIEERTADLVRFRYTHPVQPPPLGAKHRVVRVGIVYWNPNSGEAVTNNVLELRVTRPPVVMTHGLWSNREAFAAMEEALASSSYPEELLYRVDYEASNAAPFADNRRVVEYGVYSVLKQAAEFDCAAGKVDLVGHSMGGILSRLYVQGQYFNRDVRRIVTCNTPHSGSQMANWLLEGSPPAQAVCLLAATSLGSCYSGAVNDLGVYSNAVSTLLNGGAQPDGLEVHALATVDEVGAALPLPAGAAFVRQSLKSLFAQGLGPCARDDFLSTVFNGDDNDVVVAAESQAGGLGALQTSLYPGIWHVGSTAEPEVIARVDTLLGQPPGSPSFAPAYQPPQLAYTTPPPCVPPPAPLRAAGSAALSITAPAAGTTVTAGAAMTVTIDGSPEIASVLLLLAASPTAVYAAGVPGPDPSATLDVPLEFAGEHRLVAVGLDAAGTVVATSGEVPVTVAVAATLQGVAVYPPSLFLAPGQTASLEVRGEYDDGVTRDVAHVAALELTFAAGNASRAGGSSVTLVAPGDDVLTVRLAGVAAPEVPIASYAAPSVEPPARPVRRRLTPS